MPSRDKRLDPFNNGIDPPDPEWLDPPRPCGHEWRNNDFTCMDCVEARITDLQQELTRAKTEVAEFERTDLVPRSRYNAADAEAREAREMLKTIADRAKTEIERLEAVINALQAELNAARPATQSCTWLWTPEDNSGFWTAQCKEDWPIQMLHEGAKFCSFCGSSLIVEGESKS